MNVRIREHVASILNKIVSLFVFLGSLIYFLIKILAYDMSINNRVFYFQLPFLISLLFVVIVYIIHIVGSYFFTFISFEEDCIKMQNNFIIKNVVSLPYKNIHLLTEKQSVLLKFYRAKRIILNSGSRNENAELDITINEEFAKIIYKKIDTEDCSYDDNQKLYRLPNKWLLLYSLLIPSKWIRPVSYTLSALTIVTAVIINNNAFPFWIIATIYLVAIVISIGLNTLYSVLKFFNFSISEHRKCLVKIVYGKLLKISHLIYKDKVNAVLVKYDILNQLTKTCRPFLFVAGYKDKNQQLALPLLPIAKVDKLNSILASFLSEFSVNIHATHPPKQAIKTYFLPHLLAFNILALPLLVFFVIIMEPLAIPIFLLGNTALLLNARLAYKDTFFSHYRNIVYAKKGGIFSSALLCKRKTIQAIKYIHTVFNRKKNIYKIKIYIKSVKKQPFPIGYVNKTDIL